MTQPPPQVDVSQIPAGMPTAVLLLDVREPHEWIAGHIEGATHVPMMQVSERLAEIPDDRQIVVLCHAGGRSAKVTEFLVAQGRDAVNLTGGMLAWQGAGRPMVSDTGAPPRVD